MQAPQGLRYRLLRSGAIPKKRTTRSQAFSVHRVLQAGPPKVTHLQRLRRQLLPFRSRRPPRNLPRLRIHREGVWRVRRAKTLRPVPYLQLGHTAEQPRTRMQALHPVAQRRSQVLTPPRCRPTTHRNQWGPMWDMRVVSFIRGEVAFGRPLSLNWINPRDSMRVMQFRPGVFQGQSCVATGCNQVP